ncbi:NlpC/P60 family protein [Saccharothrix algeriensis]|uniref:C40 family peptidase n=1 Tax=Saccharothrix algeriensis TaxID=173560 RepID=A0A8T8HYX7_9PSEU|nr:NlpC/P60 family protein [Saccharothrix algeriensis]MBM7809257.1 cell wall-associated NlpC family hydrolase [Saccharothrix algeriensis]QTR03611.1 C40 family peptidase [Saccharothrix algeriensis]
MVFDRRSVLAGLASTAAVPLLGTAADAATPTSTAAPGPASDPVAAGIEYARDRIPGMTRSGGPSWFPDPIREPLAVKAAPGDRTEVSTDSRGVFAVLTTGARTVTVTGAPRSFTEQKRPFADRFERTVRDGWGPSPGGGAWSTDRGAPENFSVEPGRGVVLLATTGHSYFTSLADDRIGDFSATATVTLDKMPAGALTSVAVAFGYQGYEDHYRARLAFGPTGSVRLSVEVEQAKVDTPLAAGVEVGSGFTAGRPWRIRVERTGEVLRTRAWPADRAEPAGWVHTVRDSTFGAGRLALRAVAAEGSTASRTRVLVTEFAASGVWVRPPVIAHDTWVRLLPAPYSGTWTPDVEERVRAWPTDITPDALAYAAMLQTGAAPYRSPTRGGPQVLGESGYGPLDPDDGTRREGADFHEYMGIAWTFPDGEHRPAPGPEWHRALDCSGMIRMVFGYHLGVPLVTDRPADFDGRNLPRKAVHIGPHGPGVVIERDDGGKPSLTGIRVGDVVCFDADGSPGSIDHVGIYAGRDQDGRPRFVSSRKTVNGPTISDLGGESTLDGNGEYANGLRIIRRF